MHRSKLSNDHKNVESLTISCRTMPGTYIQYPPLYSSGGAVVGGAENEQASISIPAAFPHNSNSTSTSNSNSNSNSNSSRSRKQRRRRKHREQPQQPSSSDDRLSSTTSKRIKKNSTTKKKLPMPVAAALREDKQVETPQVLLWQGSKRVGHCESPSSSLDGCRQLKQEERCTSTSDLFRQEAFDRRAPSSATTFGDDPPAVDEAPLDLLAKSGPHWFQLEYWRQRLTFDKCWLPKRSTTVHTRRTHSVPPYLGYTPDQNPWLVAQSQQHPSYYVVPPWSGQVSTLNASPEAVRRYSCPTAPWSAPQAHYYPSTGSVPWHVHNPQQHLKPHEQSTNDYFQSSSPQAKTNTSQNTRSNQQKAPNSHNRTASNLPETFTAPEAEEAFRGLLRRAESSDAQSVSSLESFQSDWKTSCQQHDRLVISTDTNTPEGTAQPTLSVLPNRMARLPGLPRTTSPRRFNKPPVPPPRRGTGTIANNSSSAQGKHRPSSAVASATPQLMAPPFSNATPVSGSRPRSHSEASVNTTGSRHRRGGTICEFSFESLSSENNNQCTQTVDRPAPATRSSSLPLNWQGQANDYHPPLTVRMLLDATSDHTLVFLDEQQQAAQAGQEVETGYISPLEEEVPFIVSTTAAVATPEQALSSPDTVSGACDIDNSPQSSNPQDSFCGDDDDDDDAADRNHAKKPPEASIPSHGESWMYAWAQQENKNGIAPDPMSSFVAMTTTQNPWPSTMRCESKVLQQAQGQPKSPSVAECVVKLEYLPKNMTLEQQWTSQHGSASEGIALSGWVAFGMGESLVEKLHDDASLLERRDVTYIIAPSPSTGLWVYKPDGTFENVLEWTDCHVEVQEISRTRGRAVFVKRHEETVCTILPVYLPERYSGCRQLFDPLHCFPKGAYLPDEQQYTTMHIMFALDVLLKKSNQTWTY
jgi:hypothetical protein